MRRGSNLASPQWKSENCAMTSVSLPMAASLSRAPVSMTALTRCSERGHGPAASLPKLAQAAGRPCNIGVVRPSSASRDVFPPRLGVFRVIKFGAVPVGAGDAVSCLRCSAEEDVSYDPVERIVERARCIVDAWSAGPGPNLTLVGPDPLEHPEAGRLIHAVMELGVERLCVVTAGEALSRPGIASMVADEGVTHVRVTVLAGDAMTHDSLSGRPGSFERALAGMRALGEAFDALSAPHILCGRVPVCAHNLQALPGAVLALAQNGVRSIALDLSRASLGSQALPWVEAAVDTGMVSGAWVCTVGTGECAEGLYARPPVELLGAGAAR
ncbi:MAG: hypothetical protein C0418_00500 [Coriobacteriaceae bacterium]|nr:hypothetical protein [Coriobacteriaceae bacterium]